MIWISVAVAFVVGFLAGGYFFVTVADWLRDANDEFNQ